MTSDASPPIVSPQLSPDGRWVWDGAQWRPVAVREAAFGAFKKAGEAVPTRDSMPVPLRPATPSPLMQAPAWGGAKASARKGIPQYAYIGGGALAALLIVALILGVLPRLLAPAQQANTTPVATPTAAPGPATRSDAAEAAYVLSVLTPHVDDIKNAILIVKGVCRAGMTSSCQDSLNTINNTLPPLAAALQRAVVPSCVAAQEARLLTDLNATIAGVQLALKGFKDNSKAAFKDGMAAATKHGPPMNADYIAIRSAVPTCSTDVVGP